MKYILSLMAIALGLQVSAQWVGLCEEHPFDGTKASMAVGDFAIVQFDSQEPNNFTFAISMYSCFDYFTTAEIAFKIEGEWKTSILMLQKNNSSWATADLDYGSLTYQYLVDATEIMVRVDNDNCDSENLKESTIGFQRAFENACFRTVEIEGCKDVSSCNYSRNATFETETSCIYPELGFNCSGTPTHKVELIIDIESDKEFDYVTFYTKEKVAGSDASGMYYTSSILSPTAKTDSISVDMTPYKEFEMFGSKFITVKSITSPTCRVVSTSKNKWKLTNCKN